MARVWKGVHATSNISYFSTLVEDVIARLNALLWDVHERSAKSNAWSVCGNCKETGCMNDDDDTDNDDTQDEEMW